MNVLMREDVAKMQEEAIAHGAAARNQLQRKKAGALFLRHASPSDGRQDRVEQLRAKFLQECGDLLAPARA